MVHRSYEETAIIDADDLVQGTSTEDSLSNAFVSVMVRSPYDKMSARMQKRIVDKIISFNNLVDGKYCIKALSVGDEVSL